MSEEARTMRIREPGNNLYRNRKINKMSALLLEALRVSQSFKQGILFRRQKPILHDVSLKIHAGNTVGIVGNSGEGKTTLGKIMAGVISPTHGEVLFHGESITSMKPERYTVFRRSVQMMFQDAESVLNPRKTIETLFYEVTRLLHIPKADQEKTISTVLSLVGLPPETMDRYSHQLSGGQNQRVALARILLLDPEVIILDEPTSTLDISVQAQILHLLKNIQRQKNLGYVLISHDRDIVTFMCDKIMTLENGSCKKSSSRPHPSI